MSRQKTLKEILKENSLNRLYFVTDEYGRVLTHNRSWEELEEREVGEGPAQTLERLLNDSEVSERARELFLNKEQLKSMALLIERHKKRVVITICGVIQEISF